MSTQSYLTAGTVAFAILFAQSPAELTAASNASASLTIRYELKHDKNGKQPTKAVDTSQTPGLLKPSRFTVDPTSGALQAEVALGTDASGNREVTLEVSQGTGPTTTVKQNGQSSNVGKIELKKGPEGDSLSVSVSPNAFKDAPTGSQKSATIVVNTK